MILEQKETRSYLIKIIAFFIPFFSGVFYFILPNPITLLIIAGIWAAMGLPIVNIGALYLISKLDKDLHPKQSTKTILWLSLMLQITMALLIIYDMTVGF